jgi:plasmid replication initiation protein
MADRALYYPYIHIRDPEWLKGTLLLFSQVRRMIPFYGPQANDGPILPFTQPHGGREPMLTGADLWSERAEAAQVELARRLREDAQDSAFRNRFGQSAAETMRGTDEYGFQIHQEKLHENLTKGGAPRHWTRLGARKPRAL